MLPSHFSKILFIIFFLLFTKSAFCENYGTLGNTFIIQEEDLLEYIENKLKTIDIEKWQNEFKEEAIKSAKRPKGVILPNATKNKIYYFDPSITIQRDYADNVGRVFAKKGTKINPLDSVSLSRDLVFIDGDNKVQVEFAIQYYNAKNGKAKIILTNGSIVDLMNKLNIKLFFDQKQILVKKFEIENLPAVISQKNNLLEIKEVALKYD